MRKKIRRLSAKLTNVVNRYQSALTPATLNRTMPTWMASLSACPPDSTPTTVTSPESSRFRCFPGPGSGNIPSRSKPRVSDDSNSTQCNAWPSPCAIPPATTCTRQHHGLGGRAAIGRAATSVWVCVWTGSGRGRGAHHPASLLRSTLIFARLVTHAPRHAVHSPFLFTVALVSFRLTPKISVNTNPSAVSGKAVASSRARRSEGPSLSTHLARRRAARSSFLPVDDGTKPQSDSS